MKLERLSAETIDRWIKVCSFYGALVFSLVTLLLSFAWAETPGGPSPARSPMPVPSMSTSPKAGAPAPPPAMSPSPVAGATAPPAVAGDREGERFITIDFNDVDLSVFIKFFSELTGRNFIVDERVKGKVTVISPAKISLNEAYKVFESVLEVNGYTAVAAGEVTKIVPAPDARTKSIETMRKGEDRAPEDRMVTQIIPLKYADAAEIKRLFAPLISKSSVLLDYAPTNTLIVTDIHSNVRRLMEILDAIDVVRTGQRISVITLEHAEAETLAKTLGAMFKPGGKRAQDAAEKMIEMVADKRTNTIILLASMEDTERIRELIGMLDQPVRRGDEKIRVYYLENAIAEDLAKVLQELPKKGGSTGSGGTAGQAGRAEAPILSDKVGISADKATNSLIIRADREDYQVIEEVIKKLDGPRSMVYIESLIMEVNVTKDFRLGTEWTQTGQTLKVNNQGETVRAGSYDMGFAGGAVGGGDPGYGLLRSQAAKPATGTFSQALLGPGFSLGLFAETLKIGNNVFRDLSAVVQAYKKDRDVSILSTPQVLTTDHEEAKIVVGKNIPFQTRTSTSTENNETFNSFDYKDVGKTLKITPHISQERLVRLNISLEVTDIESIEDFKPTTLKRTVDTTVIVQDGHTVVIGGLIDNKLSNTDYRVPCLGEVPLLGWAFRSMADSGEKTNLFIFLTPRVIKSPEEAGKVYDEKQGQSEVFKKGEIDLYPKRR